MFGNKKENVNVNLVETTIGEAAVIEGKIISQTSIQIDGRVNGEVDSKGTVIVGEKGIVNANVIANELIVAGTINGNVKATEKITIKSKGKLIGETKTKSFVIDEGATFLGTSSMDISEKQNNTHNKQEDKNNKLENNENVKDKEGKK